LESNTKPQLLPVKLYSYYRLDYIVIIS